MDDKRIALSADNHFRYLSNDVAEIPEGFSAPLELKTTAEIMAERDASRVKRQRYAERWRWLDRAMGAAAMYIVSGAVVSTSMAVNTNGPCPWWLWPYWTLTWLFQIFPVIYEGLWRHGWHF